VVARDEETLAKAKKLVQVEYEPLPAIHSPKKGGREYARKKEISL